MDILLLIFLVIAGLLGAIVLVAVVARGRTHSALNVEKYRSAWLAIEQQLARDDESSHVLCVLNADKLLDKALRECGHKGQTMGERMKSAKDVWSNANGVWSAHKLRNQLAHETDARLTYEQARQALGSFKQALKDVRAI